MLIKNMCKILFIFCYIFLLLLSLSYVYGDTFEEDNWIEPNAWGREYHNQLKSSNALGGALHQQLQGSMEDSSQPLGTCNKCERQFETADHELALVFFKKFIATLFQRKKLQFNSASQTYTRSLQFVLTADQLQKLETNDPRDLDSVLSEICLNARAFLSSSDQSNDFKEDNLLTSIQMLFSDIFRDIIKILNNSEMKFCLAILGVFVCLCVLKQYYKFTVKYLIITVFAGIFLLGFFVEYLECNKRLEIEQLIEAIEEHKELNKASQPSWFSSIFGGLFGSDDDSMTETANRLMRMKAKVKLGFCHPHEVLILYWNKLIFLNLQMMIKQCIDTFKELRAHLSLAQFFAASLMLIVLIGLIVKYSFKYILSPRAWSHLLHSPRDQQPSQALPNLQQQQAIDAGGDRLSGENLRLFLQNVRVPNVTLNSLTAVTNEQNGSGVQEILEAAAITRDETDSSSSSRASDNSFEIIRTDSKEVDEAEESINKKSDESIDEGVDELSDKSSGTSETTDGIRTLPQAT